MRISDWSSDVCSSDLCCHDRSSALDHPLRHLQLDQRLTQLMLDMPDIADHDVVAGDRMAERLLRQRIPNETERPVGDAEINAGKGEGDPFHLADKTGTEWSAITFGGDRHLVEHAGLRARGEHDECLPGLLDRSEEHTSELQSLMRISYAVFCLKKTRTSKE